MVDIAEFHCANIKYQELEGHIQRNICLEYRAGSYAIDFQIESVLALNKKTESELLDSFTKNAIYEICCRHTTFFQILFPSYSLHFN